jgi:hypothetical protein
LNETFRDPPQLLELLIGNRLGFAELRGPGVDTGKQRQQNCKRQRA